MVTRQKLKKTQVGIELIRRIAAEGDRVFSTERARKLAPEVGLKESYLLEALYHLHRNGWIVSLRRGLYSEGPTLISCAASWHTDVGDYVDLLYPSFLP